MPTWLSLLVFFFLSPDFQMSQVSFLLPDCPQPWPVKIAVYPYRYVSGVDKPLTYPPCPWTYQFFSPFAKSGVFQFFLAPDSPLVLNFPCHRAFGVCVFIHLLCPLLNDLRNYVLWFFFRPNLRPLPYPPPISDGCYPPPTRAIFFFFWPPLLLVFQHRYDTFIPPLEA